MIGHLPGDRLRISPRPGDDRQAPHGSPSSAPQDLEAPPVVVGIDLHCRKATAQSLLSSLAVWFASVPTSGADDQPEAKPDRNEPEEHPDAHHPPISVLPTHFNVSSVSMTDLGANGIEEHWPESYGP